MEKHPFPKCLAICWYNCPNSGQQREKHVARLVLAAMALAAFTVPASGFAKPCDRTCLQQIADSYRAAYLAHDTSKAPFGKALRFSENGVAMKFPDASWDTVTSETGPALTALDPVTGSIGIYTAVMQAETPGFLAVRLKVRNRQIVEVEHVLATRRLVSSPPVVFGDAAALVHDPELSTDLKPSEKRPRDEMIRIADGYFVTLEKGDGKLYTKFTANCHRTENGKEFAAEGCDKGFLLGNYRFNERVRDRDFFLVDEQRGLVMARFFIDHKGKLDVYKLTDGTAKKSPFREPHTWSGLELWKIKDGAIGPIETDFIGVPYNTAPVWPAGKRP